MGIRLSDNPNVIAAYPAKEFDVMVKVTNPIFDFFVVNRIDESLNDGYRLGRWGISSLINIKDDTLKLHGKAGEPFVVGFSNGDNTYKGSALVIGHTTKYYHAFHEIFPRILFAKSIDPNIKVYLYGALGLRDGGKFFGMSKDDKHEFDTLDHYHPYFLEFLEYFDIDYICLNEDQFFPTSFDTAYLFYEYRHESSLDLLDPADQIIHPDLRIFDEDDRPYDPQLLYNKESSESYFDSIEILQDAFPTNGIEPDKNIYISRRNYKVRQYQYEDKLEEYFKSIGYDIVYMELIPWADQIKLIQQSKNIVCPIGTSVVNTQLCTPKNNVIALGIRDVDEENFIETMNKHYQVMLEHYDIPFHPIDIPEGTDINDAIEIIDGKLKEINATNLSDLEN